MYCYIVYVQVMTKTQRIKRTPGAESLSPRVDGPSSVWSHFCRPSPKNGAMIVNPGGPFSFVMLVPRRFLPAASRLPATSPRGPASEVVVIAYVQIHVEGLAVAVPVGREHVLVEGPVHAYGCRKGGGEKFQRRRFRNRSRLPSEVLKHLKWLWSNESRRCLIWCRSKQGDTRDSTPGVEWTMLRYSAAGMQIRATASETSRFKVHIIKSLIKSKWCNGPIEAGTDKEGPW